MHYLLIVCLAARIVSVIAQAPSIDDFSLADIVNGAAFQEVSDVADNNMRTNIARRRNATCTYSRASVRTEWRDLPNATRKSFTDAVICLQKLPPQVMTPEQASEYPGVRSRHDEFVATHINYTYNVHATADFFAWHRAFVQFYHNDLKSFCGYNDVMPYWNWALDHEAPQNSSVFSGDAYSMGSNGVYIPDRADTWLAVQDVTYPAGTGGGCVKRGPFSNLTLHLGPLDLPNTNNVNSSYEYNPRCLARDLNPWFSQRYNSWDNITRLMLENIYISDFQNLAQGYGSTTNKFGMHGGGHWQTGGTMADFHSSPADPIFYLHHGMIDRVWTIWQNLDITRRQTIISGTSTMGNIPPSAPMTLNDTVPFGFVTRSYRLGDLMDTFAGPFCYRYA